jgi:deoxyribonuclease V
VKIARSPHRWKISPKQAVAVQRRLADRVVTAGRVASVRLLAGADLAFTADGRFCIAGVVVWDVASQTVVEQHTATRPVTFPYVPGLLSFREAPTLLGGLRRLRCEPDAFMFDGQGFAHPRRMGLACHLGVLLDRPSLGCGKSRLIGAFEEPGAERGAWSPLTHDGECIGAVVRTREGTKPIFVSVGHRMALEEAIRITMLCCTKYRIPEPTRQADQLVARVKRQRAAKQAGTR